MNELPAAPVSRGPLLLLLKLAVAAIGVVLVIRVARRVDWSQVLDAIGRLHWWQVGVIAVAVLVRQTLCAVPMVFLVPGLGMRKAVLNGLAGTMMTTFTPPPSEIVLRLAMFKSWRIDATRGASALALNTLLFYVTRFAVPLLGLALALVLRSAGAAYWWAAALGAALALALIGILALISKGEYIAARVGRAVGGALQKIRKRIDPDEWAARLVGFQRDSSADLGTRMLPGALALVAFVVVDGTIVVLCMRFLGIPASSLSYLVVIAAVLCVYPLTFFPFAGVGVLDAALIALLTDVSAVGQADLIAALVVWRVATLVFPVIPGVIALTVWRHTTRAARVDLPAAAQPEQS